MSTPTTYHLADLFEAVVPRVRDRVAVTEGSESRTYGEFDARANQLARALRVQGVGAGDHVALYLLNGIAYSEALIACFKLRAVPININYRYLDEELEYLFRDAQCVAVIAHRSFADRTERLMHAIEDLRVHVSVDNAGTPVPNDAVDYEAAIAAQPTDPLGIERSNNDTYLLYTGGTTGMPKGVVWRIEDAFFACIGGGDPMRMSGPINEPAELLDRIIDFDFTAFPLAPMMHAAAQWISLSWWLCGARVVLHPGSFDALETWKTVERERVSTLIVVGDAMVRPLIDAWDEHGPFDVSSMYAIGSGGAPLTPALKDRLMEICPAAMVTDGFGSSETGAQGGHRIHPGERSGGATRFVPMSSNTAVVTPDGRIVTPGSGEEGVVALTGRIPLGYFNDPVKTAENFVVIDGQRWVRTSDVATVDEDGTIVLRGRANQTINTGGEKVFPEEVEASLKSHPDVYDAVVTSAPHDRFGQQVCAVVRFRGEPLSLAAIAEHVKGSLSGYKVPRAMVVVDQVERSPSGKPDYRWARRVVDEAIAENSLIERAES